MEYIKHRLIGLYVSALHRHTYRVFIVECHFREGGGKMAATVKTVCTIEEIKDIVEVLKLNIDNLDDVEILLPCASGGMCHSGCQSGCQACQPGNRYGPAAEGTEDDEEDEENEVGEFIIAGTHDN